MRYLISLAFAFIFFSCKDDSANNLMVYKVMDEALLQSNEIISMSNSSIYNSMDEQLAAPETSAAMAVWQPKARRIKALSDSMVSYIDELKKELVEEAGSGKSGDKDAFEQNSTVTNHVFSSHGRGKELFEKLVNYKSDMLAVDPKLYNTFKDRITVFGKGFDQKRGPKEFTETFFSNTPGIASIAMLRRIENNIKVTENQFITYCNSTMCIINIVYDSFAPFASISSAYVKTGERIEVTTGIVTFTTVANAKISINNVPIPINTNGIAIYNFKTPLKAGIYSVPIKFEYTEIDGRKMTASKKLSYTVIEQ